MPVILPKEPVEVIDPLTRTAVPSEKLCVTDDVIDDIDAAKEALVDVNAPLISVAIAVDELINVLVSSISAVVNLLAKLELVDVKAPLISFVNLLAKLELVDVKAPLISFVNLFENDALVDVKAPLISFVNLFAKLELVESNAPLISFVNLVEKEALSTCNAAIFVANELLSSVKAPLISVAI